MSVQHFKSLYKHFIKVTCSRTIPAGAAPTPGHDIPSEEPTTIVTDETKLNPLFKQFCEEGEKHFSHPHAPEHTKTLYSKTIEEYMIMKKAIEEELHILSLNRVGMEKNFKNIMSQTASHVGLQLPKQY